jgi:ABC-type uncharacterized transport system permease subunit
MMEKKNSVTNKLMDVALGNLLDPIFAIIFSFALGAIIIAALGYDVGLAYKALFSGAFGSIKAISQTILAATPLMFTAMAFSTAYRCGMFNLGAEGQFYMGAIMGAWAGFAIKGLPPVLHVLVVVLAGALGGMAVGFIPAILKAKRGVNEVIVCIMMNYISINVTNYLVSTEGPLRVGSTLPATPMIQDTAKLPELIGGTRLTGGFLFGIFFAIALYLFLWKTRGGYKIRAVGDNPFAAECGGIKRVKYSILAMIIAGALAGIGGSIEIIGIHNRFYGKFSPGYGFEGIAVGMLGSNHPFGILLSALLFGALKTGAMAMQIQAGTNAELVKILQALVIFFIAGKWSVMTLIFRAKSKQKSVKQV